MIRLNNRIGSVLKRASQRFYKGQYFETPTGRRVPFNGVCRIGAAEGELSRGSAIASESRELLVSSKEFNAFTEALRSEKDFSTLVKSLRGSSVVEEYEKGRVVWKFDPSSPIEENTPGRAFVRIYLVRNKG